MERKGEEGWREGVEGWGGVERRWGGGRRVGSGWEGVEGWGGGEGAGRSEREGRRGGRGGERRRAWILIFLCLLCTKVKIPLFNSSSERFTVEDIGPQLKFRQGKRYKPGFYPVGGSFPPKL